MIVCVCVEYPNSRISITAKKEMPIVELASSNRRVSHAAIRLTESSFSTARLDEVCAALNADSVVVLELWGCGLTPAHAARLGEALKGSASLTALELGGNAINEAGARAIVAGVREGCTTLATLGLDGTNLGDSSGKELAAVVRSSASSLTCLKLQHNNLTDATASALAEAIAHAADVKRAPTHQLQHLHLQRNKIGERGAAALERCVGGSALLEVDLKYNLVTRPRLLARIDAACRTNAQALRADGWLSHDATSPHSRVSPGGGGGGGGAASSSPPSRASADGRGSRAKSGRSSSGGGSSRRARRGTRARRR